MFHSRLPSLRYIAVLAAALGAVVLPACGGGGSDAPVAAAGAPASAPAVTQSTIRLPSTVQVVSAK